MYAVVDLQTTGTKTTWHDRIVEIAIVRLDETGKVLDEWCTLVNPDRDLGPQELHGISGAEARRAPVFAELAGQIAERLAGRLIVAHNLLFDAGFLTAEFGKLGVAVPVDDERGLCTMRLAGHFLPTASRSLAACRAAAGLGPHREQSALHGARAAGELLGYYLERAGDPPPWAELLDSARQADWPRLRVTTVAAVPRRRPEEREPHFLTRLVDRLPRQLDPKADAYLALLDGVLLDRHISASEADQLVAIAARIGLSRADAELLHHRYLCGLATVALADQILTPAERLDLDGVAELLGLTSADVDRALAEPAAQVTRWQLTPGDQVVFTGDLHPPREHLEVDALTHGLRTARKVTKQTRLLVAADPDSLSGVAKLARQYGIPIVTPAAYKTMLEALLSAQR
ncbi:DNA polymerase III subunit epsilon [Actinoplanes sp. SE50]|uniref:exonuclease domain-containing protein n=1 Tax=unclassified Actinoplanes TaxID=2626549 RepID=UPI00023EC50B|nr:MULTISPECIES: exonuclease domain-containing protein [unclassified Actinoplanes]AEV87574.1 DNA polymerase III subunit epsilon [Actinoplanes sp. SE50/110]ATO85977.1 DNA polymerase III subunit epsilon [Actinoplanes sp. SE50]SLM03391.1 DNA polymerase III subunit epsilon [Actinoplanes sp. SE50/110]